MTRSPRWARPIRASSRWSPAAGRPPLRRRADGFAGLAATVVSQQLSTASAAAIWGRLAAAFDPFEPPPSSGRAARGWPGSGSRRQNPHPEGNRPRSCRERLVSRVFAGPSRRGRSCRADRGARRRSLDRRYLSVLLSRPRRRLAGRRSRFAGSGRSVSGCPRDRREGDDHAGRTMATWRAVAARILWTYYRGVKGREGAPVAKLAPKGPVAPKQFPANKVPPRKAPPKDPLPHEDNGR